MTSTIDRYRPITLNQQIYQVHNSAILIQCNSVLAMHTTDDSYHCLTIYVMFNCIVTLLIYTLKQTAGWWGNDADDN